MKKNVSWAFFILILVSTASMAQDKSRNEEYALQAEQVKRAMLMRILDSGVLFMDMGNYTVADQKFQYVLNNTKSVPSDLTFYFGKNSYYLEKYKQSIDWLTKYVQLKGSNGQFSEEAQELLRKSENAYLQEKSKAASKAGEVLSTDYEIDCGPDGKVICPVCKGDHVITKKGPFGIVYQTCSYCNEHGLLSCEEYNQLLRGELKAKL
ncbi:MAG TPA: hypothetical protein PLJ60_07440 [Chryseolinea sp.]|nr:hypothetical protein [Chryseolinea sp.]HPM30155.1 hypothetical protein [Chryseolinea sp.]